MKIILATASPHRIEAMKFTGIPFEAIGSNVEEKFEGRPNSPEEIVRHLSKLKAEAVAKNCVDSLVIGMDSVGYFRGNILEKPKSYEEAFERLRKLSGNKHEFYTGITMINTKTKKICQEVVLTRAEIRKLTDEEIKKYLDEDKRYKTFALGYDPYAHSSASFIKHLEGDPMNIQQGIPLAKIIEMIREFGK